MSLGVIDQMSRREAENITEQIVGRLDQVAENIDAVQSLMREALQRRAHLALGYDSPGAYMRDRFEGTLVNLSAALRREIVHEMSDAGISTRAIAPIFGVSQKTIVKDSQVIPEVSPPAAPNEPQAQDEIEAITAPVENAPRAVTGLDGKTYPVVVPPKPRRRALTDQARDAGWDARKVAERLQRLRDDDRFTKNKEEVAAQLRHHLAFVIDTCQGFLDDLNQLQED